MAEEKKQRPLISIRAGNISASVFENTYKKEGKADFKIQTISLQKSYTEDEGKTWKNQSISIRKSDLPKLQVVLNKLLEHQFLNSKEDKEE
jgi:Neuraminidase (sialidase)